MTHTESVMRLVILMMAEDDWKKDILICPYIFEIAEMHLVKQALCIFPTFFHELVIRMSRV